MILELIFLLIQLALAVFLFFMVIAFVTGAPFVPSTNPTSLSMVGLAHIKPGMKIYDLGSGDGRLLFLASRAGAQAIGFEINPWLVLFTNIKAILSGKHKSVVAYWKNFWTAKVGDADVIFVYLLPWRMGELEKKLFSQLQPGALIVSNSFIFKDRPIVRKDEKNHVYVFRV